MATTIQIRRDTAVNWTANNPILAEGEFGFETDTKKKKIGDGVTTWNLLDYEVSGGIAGTDGADGLSAYQVAVSSGYVGNEAQWLASLKGADGVAGPQGATGATGLDGAQGNQGAKGDKGDAGSVTVNGIDLVEYAKYDIATGNLLNTANIIENSVINTSGNLQSGLSGYSCVLIDCKENTNYTYSGFTLASSTTRVLLLNASNTKISDIDLDTTTGTFKTPVGCTKFYFNTKWNGVSSYSTNQIEEGEVATAYVDYALTKLSASNIADETLDIEKFVNSFLAPDKNILDQFSITESTVVNTAGDLQTGASNYSAIKINCMENTDYAYSGFTLTGQIRVLYLNDSNAKISSELLPDISGTFTTPIGCVAFWFNTKWNGTSSYATNQIEEGSVATSYDSYSLKTLNRNKFQHSIPALPEVISSIKGRLTSLETNGTPHPFNGKIINFLGDSISTVGSSGASTTGTNYFNVFGTSIGASLVRAYGVPGDPITGGFPSRYAAMDSNADLIVVFGGVNDFITGQTLGTITDTGSSTFYGSVNTLMSGLLSKYNGKDIIFMTPMHNVGDQTPNSVGLLLQDYSKAITACGLKWGIPILDLTANLGINANITTGYYTDGTHPSDAGHSRIAAKLVKYTNTL